MAKQMSPEKEREYEELLAFVDFHATNINGIEPQDPVHPTNAGAGIVAEFGRSRALQGTKQAVNDIIEELSYQPAEYVALLDRLLRERGIVTVSEAAAAMLHLIVAF